MKKQHLILGFAAAMLLASCGGQSSSSHTGGFSSKTDSTEPSSEPAPSKSETSAATTETSTATSSSEEDYLVDITLKVTVKGIVVSDTNAIWLGSSLGTEGGNWAVYRFTKSETEEAVWTYTFEDIEPGAYAFNFYVADKDGSGDHIWNDEYINAEGTSVESRRLLVEDAGDYPLDATFAAQPERGEVDLKVAMTITNYDGTFTSWPQLVYNLDGGSTVWEKNLVQDEENKNLFTVELKGLQAGTFAAHLALWEETESWAEYDIFGGADAAEHIFDLTGTGTLSVTGELKLRDENSVGTWAFVAD